MILDFIGDLLVLGYGKESESKDVVEANILSVVLATILYNFACSFFSYTNLFIFSQYRNIVKFFLNALHVSSLWIDLNKGFSSLKI